MGNKIIIIVLLVLACLVGAFYLYNKSVAPVEPVVIAQTKEEMVAVLNQKILNGGIFITPLEVISDSRCPVDVQCIWAGEVSLKVRLEKGTVSKEVILKLQIPFTFEENKISLIGVTPENNSKKLFAKEDYRFTFLVVPFPLPVGKTGTISGIVTTGPSCPVERIPPEPGCAPTLRPQIFSVIQVSDKNCIIIKYS